MTGRTDAGRRRVLPIAAALGVLAIAAGGMAAWQSPWGRQLRYDRISFLQLKRITDADPNDLLAWRTLGLRLARAGDGQLAEPALRRALVLDPSDPEVATGLGEILLSRGETAEAYQYLRGVVERQPRYTLARMALGNLYRRRGAYHRAAEQFEAILAYDPAYSDAHYQAGYCYLQMQQTKKAEAAVDQALRLSPGEPYYLRVKASVLAATGRQPQAVQALQEALKALPGNPPLLANLATLILTSPAGEADLALAESTIDELRAKDEDHPLLPYLTGRLHLARSRWKEAVPALEEARDATPEQDEVYFALSQAYRRVGREADAEAALAEYGQRQELRRRIDELRIRLAIDEKKAPLHLRIAELQLRMGRPYEAAASLESALAEDPSLDLARKRLDALTAHLKQHRPGEPGGEALP